MRKAWIFLGLVFAVGVVAFGSVATQGPAQEAPAQDLAPPEFTVHNPESGVAVRAEDTAVERGQFRTRLRVSNDAPHPATVRLRVEAYSGDALVHSDAMPDRQDLAPSESFAATLYVDTDADRVDVFVSADR